LITDGLDTLFLRHDFALFVGASNNEGDLWFRCVFTLGPVGSDQKSNTDGSRSDYTGDRVPNPIRFRIPHLSF
jgi:hypothetical protein